MYSIKKLSGSVYTIHFNNIYYLYRVVPDVSIVNQVYNLMIQIQYDPKELTEELFTMILKIVSKVYGISLNYNDFFRLFDGDTVKPHVFQYLNTVRKLIQLNKTDKDAATVP
jgi:hypothetical protein